jgi:hypothetical protein
MENTEKTAQDWAMGDIMTISDLTTHIARVAYKKTNEVQDLLIMGKTMEAIKLTIEIKYLLDKQIPLFHEMGKRSEQAAFTDFRGSTLNGLDYSDFLIPNDFWEQDENKKRLQRLASATLQSGKLQYQ